MSLSDVMLQNCMPRNFLDSDDEADTWSLSSKRSSSRNSSSSSDSGMPFTHVPKDIRDQPDFRLFQDYFGLSNLLNNVKISEDNPLLYNTQQRAMLQRVRRASWSSDASDSAAVLSPTIETNYDRGFDGNFPPSIVDSAYKQLPPPSMRLSKAMRDHIISGAYQQQLSSRGSEKVMPIPPPLSQPPLPPSPPRQQPPQPPIMQNLSVQRQQSSVQVCVFCRNNGESESVYTSHVLKDADGRTSCPILRAYTCPICKANGDSSHTIKYCPMNQNARAGVMGQQPPNLSMGQRTPLPPPQPRMGGFRPPLPMNLLPPPPPPPGHARLPPPPGKHRP